MGSEEPVNLLDCIERFTSEFLNRCFNSSEGGKKSCDKEISLLRKKFLEDIERLSVRKCRELGRVNDWLSDVAYALRRCGFAVLVFEAELKDVGLVGTSEGPLHNVFEVGLSWDLVRDLPYFPASGIKGSVRSVLLSKCAELKPIDLKLKCLESVLSLLGWVEKPPRKELSTLAEFLDLPSPNNEELELLHEVVKASYGVSRVVFVDAYPVGCPKDNEGNRDSDKYKRGLIRPWVITPHYAGNVETEYDVQPTPVVHVVLSEGVTFKFVVGVKHDGLIISSKLLDLLKGGDKLNVNNSFGGSPLRGLILIASAMTAALEAGLGARTAKGYGRFQVSSISYMWGEHA